MNPFNREPLTAEQLQKDCLSYMSIQQQPVKSSRLFLGRIHDVNVEWISGQFGAGRDDYKKVKLNQELLQELKEGSDGRVFFRNRVPEKLKDESVDLQLFGSFETAYHRLMIDLVDLVAEAIQLVIPEEDPTRTVYISGGFSKNPIFLHLLAGYFPGKHMATSEVTNGTSLGAALVLWKAIDPQFSPVIRV
jgi:sugar (pentulose or hexulose) kinase